MADTRELKLQVPQLTRRLLDVVEKLGDTRYRSANDIAVGFIWEGLQRHLGFDGSGEIEAAIDAAERRKQKLDAEIERKLENSEE